MLFIHVTLGPDRTKEKKDPFVMATLRISNLRHKRIKEFIEVLWLAAIERDVNSFQHPTLFRFTPLLNQRPQFRFGKTRATAPIALKFFEHRAQTIGIFAGWSEAINDFVIDDKSTGVVGDMEVDEKWDLFEESKKFIPS
ncbi:uncharacterized protein LACBIDRAFT_322438 [Laccaria bicolor S238N-H82]|uniref:Predicted protein n=1 Tax=Laccaria bicolor (strain S238N-H82 / ATCC MYA-4686) TaxID=486041 RepID=B0CWA3_LACBS|nr:uncharacterized protein LACBIDRAFT_322438 [Laccaria bicolor S238N-H82]EDR13032.1 predicted protein [Laccaria bicolor S238N-H82]|eukprot:XP_001875530.1 predicted protein [Laccaria bicolor S238N-H82]